MGKAEKLFLQSSIACPVFLKNKAFRYQKVRKILNIKRKIKKKTTKNNTKPIIKPFPEIAQGFF